MLNRVSSSNTYNLILRSLETDFLLIKLLVAYASCTFGTSCQQALAINIKSFPDIANDITFF